MSSQSPKLNIPPYTLLILAAAGFCVALAVLLVQPQFTAAGWAGVGVGVLSVLAWALFNPVQVNALLRGRFVRFGGVAALVMVVFCVALVLVYIVVREQRWHVDFSNSDTFSLNEQTARLITALAEDPTVPDMRIIGFLGAAQGAQRDIVQVLLEDYTRSSNGRITYELIDPDRFPQQMTFYNAVPGQFIVGTLQDDTLNLDSLQYLEVFTQGTLTQAIVRLSAADGDYRAYVLNISDSSRTDDATPTGAQLLATELSDRFGWQVIPISLFDLQTGTQPFNDPAADGEVLLMMGGLIAPDADQYAAITTYLDAGGNMVLFAKPNLSAGESVANATALSNYLWGAYGVRFERDLIVDPFAATNSLLELAAAAVAEEHPIFAGFLVTDTLLFEAPLLISQAAPLPPNITHTVLARTSPDAYAKAGIDFSQTLTEADFAYEAGDLQGSLPLAIAAEDDATGARIVLYSSDAMVFNEYYRLQSAGIRNAPAARDSIFWAADFSSSAATLASNAASQASTDVPLFADAQQLRNLSFLTVLALPFVILVLGITVWWRTRERVV